MELLDYGWSDYFDQSFEPYRNSGLIPARVAEEHRELYSLVGEQGEFRGRVSGRFQFTALSRADYPAVGDWVAVSPALPPDEATIQAVLPRRANFSRKAVLAGGSKDSGGRTEEQMLAANVDLLFLVTGLDHDFKVRRIERYLAVAVDSGSRPLIVLNKADICDDVAGRTAQVVAVAGDVPVIPVSAVTGDGVELLAEYLSRGVTAVFLGSSGVGKSTLINSLLGETRQDTGGVRLDDSKGRHTTSRREMILLPTGGLLIDTPGIRRLSLWGDEANVSRSFTDVEALVELCRFADCSHDSEPGCAVQEAVASGDLDAGRLANYFKLKREARKLALRKDVRSRREEERTRSKYYRRVQREKRILKKNGLE